MRLARVCKICGQVVESENVKAHLFDEHKPSDFFDYMPLEDWDEFEAKA